MLPPFEPEQIISKTIREEWGRLLAALVNACGDIQLAEDCLQEAALLAMSKWKNDGVPGSPTAWMMTVARRKAIDRLRRDQSFQKKSPEISYLMDLENQSEETDVDAVPDKRLEMMFTCCHPALEEKSRVALTLRTLGGLSTEEIARAYLDKPETMGQRLSRAKKKIAQAGIPYAIPDETALPERLSSVLGVIYLIFNAGYDVSGGPDFVRSDLSDEAIRLARILNELLPDETEVAGLLALTLLHDARRRARSDTHGNFIPLSLQNRSRWNDARIKEGVALLEQTLKKGRVGPYQLQAAISALHNNAQAWEDTDWAQIVELYGVLARIQPGAIVNINQSVAMAYAGNHTAGLSLLKSTFEAGGIENYQPYFTALAELSSIAGQFIAAEEAYDRAIALSDSQAQKDFLASKKKKLRLQ